MQRMLTPLAAACLLAIAPLHAVAAYSSMVVFGDSLSDAGQRPNGTTVTNPVRHTNQVGPTYDGTSEEYGSTAPMQINDALGLAPQVASTNLVRSLMGQPDGNNWAVGGYTTEQIYESIVGTHVPGGASGGSGGSVVRAGVKDTDTLIRGRDGYLVSLQKAGQSIDANTLFYINGGGNDFLQGLIVDQATAQASAGRILASIEALRSAGAKTFLVPLLVDVENPASPVGAAQEAQYALSQAFNGTLLEGLNNIDAQVIPLNVPLLYREVLANPSLYGFDASQNLTRTCFDSVVNTGPTGCGNATWGAQSATPDPSKLIYTDLVHPTVAMHSILAGQAISILSAPWQISLLPEMASGSLRSSQDAMRNQFNGDWGQWQPVAQWRGFVTGGYTQQNFDRTGVSASGDGKGLGLNIGASYRLDENWRAGLALSLQDQELEAGSQDSEFDLKSYIGSAFAQYHDGLMWFDVSASVGHLDYASLDRKFAMGPVTRTEKGSTDGKLWALSGRLGVELGVQEDALKISPFVSADYSRIEVDGYSEKGASSTALSYGDQKRTSQRLGLGVQARYQLSEQTSAFGEIAREKEFKDGHNSVNMRLNALPSGFTLQGYETQNALTRFNLGLKHQLNDGLALQAAYNYRHGADDNLHGANLSLVFDW